MSGIYTLQLSPDVEVRDDGNDILLVSPLGALRVRRPGPALQTLLDNLARGGKPRDALCDEAIHSDPGGADLARLYFALDEIERKGFVHYTATDNGRALATLEPMSLTFRFEAIAIEGKLRLSRFACLRRVNNRMIVECPLGHARVVLHDSRAAALVALLAAPHTIAELSTATSGIGEPAVAAIAGLLANARAAGACAHDEHLLEDDDAALGQWEFHDLLFHSRTRLGRHNSPYGGTFRFQYTLPALPAVKPALTARRVPLYKPDMLALEAHDVPFSRVSEERHSQRRRGEQPLSAAQLGEFLYRTARVKRICQASLDSGRPYDVSIRPAPSGGASHELELYLTVVRCRDLEPGLYHYDPLGHELEHVVELNRHVQRLLDDACLSAATDTAPDVLITISARFQRVSWKYESIAYAIMLKNAGALYQQMYLVATAMNLAPCALGGGNSDLFAEAAGLDYYTETSIGEFLLSSR